MNIIPTKIYYDNQSGKVILVIPEKQTEDEPTTIQQDIDIYPILKDTELKSISCKEIEYGLYSKTFNNVKDYYYNLENNEMVFEYFTDEELDKLHQDFQLGLNTMTRVNEIFNFALSNPNVITSIEKVIEDFKSSL